VEGVSVLKNPSRSLLALVQGLKTSLLWRFGLVSGLLGSADRVDNDFFNRLGYSPKLNFAFTAF